MRKTLKKYSAIPIIIVFVALVIINTLIYSSDNQSDAFADLSMNGYFTLSPVTKELVSSMDTDVYIYATENRTDSNSMVLYLLRAYARACDHLTVETIDPKTNSGLLAQFGIPSADMEYIAVTNKSKTRTKVFSADSLFVTDDNGNRTAFKGEQIITGAIQYILSGVEQHVVLLSGHGETSASSISLFSDSLEDMGYVVDTQSANNLSLDSSSDMLFIISPRNDISETEAEYIKSFLSAGGRMIVFRDNTEIGIDGGLSTISGDMPNLTSILSSYGLSVNRDIVVANDSSGSSLRATRLVIGADATDGGIVIGECSSISVKESSGIKQTTLLSTGDSYHAKPVGSETLIYTKGDAVGPFVLGVLAETNGSKVALFSSSSFIDDNDISIVGNKSLALNVVSSLLKKDDVLTPAIKPLTVTNGISVNSFTRYMLLFLFVVVLPTVILVLGIIMWSRLVKS